MTRDQFVVKHHELVSENLLEDVHKEVARLIDSGAIDLESYENDYVAPKLVLAQALKNVAESYAPLFNQHKKELANLSKF